MKRIVLWFASTAAAVTAMFTYHTSTAGALTSGGATTSETPASSGGTSSSESGMTWTGETVQTEWGPVQVQVTTENGQITGVTVLQQPTGNPRDVEINDYALPILVEETLDAQSADIDMVSGATVTSQGYVASLQSALDQAGL